MIPAAPFLRNYFVSTIYEIDTRVFKKPLESSSHDTSDRQMSEAHDLIFCVRSGPLKLKAVRILVRQGEV